VMPLQVNEFIRSSSSSRGEHIKASNLSDKYSIM
jgi:hypothetical protein